jgi:hypothetical protein
MFSGFGGVDWVVVFAFFAIAVIYVIVPVIGYEPRRPSQFAASLYLLVAYASVTLVQQLLQYLHFLEGSSVNRGNSSLEAHVIFGFAAVKTLLFIIALFTFVIGLQSLWLKKNEAETP